MLKTIDVGLMTNHLSAHTGVLKRLELYTRITKSPQLLSVLGQQIGAMKNHVEVMNTLLDPDQSNQIILAPVPQSNLQPNQQPLQLDMADYDMTLDAHFTAMAMANDNFVSSSNMKNPQVKKLHSDMAMQQSQIAKQYETFAEQMGWMTHPNATMAEQQQAVNPIHHQPIHPSPSMSNHEQAKAPGYN
ncbi:hypothetical protein D7Z54_34080 [Salibacterium salarium]|uniref:Spore coat protein n=1 Tax=Salibacterium salarium TaxID=284579 RepID=A0A3R9P2S6_9BACI|nr:hypothetical protein [Salibacterium salarium]RSL28899.1 hypothetical protein D7Z54_34080 [Salibacterium salarium]